MLKIRQIEPKISKKCIKLLQKFYSQQKAREFPSKFYCWSSNLLGTSCLSAATICNSGYNIDLNELFPSLCNNPLIFKTGGNFPSPIIGAGRVSIMKCFNVTCTNVSTCSGVGTSCHCFRKKCLITSGILEIIFSNDGYFLFCSKMLRNQ